MSPVSEKAGHAPGRFLVGQGPAPATGTGRRSVPLGDGKKSKSRRDAPSQAQKQPLLAGRRFDGPKKISSGMPSATQPRANDKRRARLNPPDSGMGLIADEPVGVPRLDPQNMSSLQPLSQLPARFMISWSGPTTVAWGFSKSTGQGSRPDL